MLERAEPAVVYEDDDILVVDKPSGLATTSSGPRGSLTSQLEQARGERLHASSRLDLEVSGLVTFARTKRGIEALSGARERGDYGRLYLALIAPTLEADEGRWQVPIGIDPRDRRLRVAAPTGQGAEGVQAAATRFSIAARHDAVALLRLFPETGRTHQLRVHAAHAGAPIFGDARYGGPARVAQPDGRVHRARRVMLHCAHVALGGLGTQGAPLAFVAPAPADMRALYGALGGAGADLTTPPPSLI